MATFDSFTRVEFRRFKAFRAFSISMRQFNILVGPNNAGKSTILTAFRILAAALRRADTRKAEIVSGPTGSAYGHVVDLGSISVAEENIFHDYDNSEPASVTFHLSTGNTLTLFFPTQGGCVLLPDAQGKLITTPTIFKANFKCPIGFVPILGPVEHHEPLFEKEAARLALFNYRAARNFRNIWYHYPDRFALFRTRLQETWPGMDIQLPEVDVSHAKPRLHMYCPENRIPREIFWSGFGFQVWCQMLTHLVQSSDASLFLIDEPDIYLHSELQRQLLGLLRNLGPDILLATHSTEIITEAEADEILIINKRRPSAKRMRNAGQMAEVFGLLGSNINPILTQLAKSRRALFVEGKDFHILGAFARKLGALSVGNRTDFAVVPVGGFSPDRIRDLKLGIETTLGGQIVSAAILDRDYRSEAECDKISKACGEFCSFVAIHRRKEIENFLLVPAAIDRAAARKIADRAKRFGTTPAGTWSSEAVLDSFAAEKKNYVASRYMAERRRFERSNTSGLSETTVNETALDELDEMWSSAGSRLSLIPGKDAIGHLNSSLQAASGVSVTAAGIIEAMKADEVADEMKGLIALLTEFTKAVPPP